MFNNKRIDKLEDRVSKIEKHMFYQDWEQSNVSDMWGPTWICKSTKSVKEKLDALFSYLDLDFQVVEEHIEVVEKEE